MTNGTTRGIYGSCECPRYPGWTFFHVEGADASTDVVYAWNADQYVRTPDFDGLFDVFDWIDQGKEFHSWPGV